MLKKMAGTSLRLGSKIIFIGIVLIILYFAGIKAYEFVYEFVADTPAEDIIVKDIEVTIPRGANTKQIATILKEEGLIKNTTMFNVRVRFSDYNGKLRFGTYLLNTGMTNDEIINILGTQGEQKATIKFTIPEGFSVQQIGQRLEDEGIVTKDEFYDAVNNVTYDYRFFSEIPTDREYRLQGYLFPDTYEIYEDATATDIVSRMLSRFDSIITAEAYDQAEELGYTLDEIIILASLIEKEAKMESERPTIAGVMYNRLDIGMPLQIDATVQYILSQGMYQAIRLTYADLEVDSPYNTYKYKGIPVGPISNPGNKAIEAALNPESHDYFYYLLTNPETGEHVFNRTLEEHNRDKNIYIR